MSSTEPFRQRIGDFYADAVLPALADRLDTAFPAFGWKRDARGWVATNEEMTHRVLGVRADRVIAHGPAPRGSIVHGGEATLQAEVGTRRDGATGRVTGGPSSRARLEPAVAPELPDVLEEAMAERIRVLSAAFRGGYLRNGESA